MLRASLRFARVPLKRKGCGAHHKRSQELPRAALRFARVPLKRKGVRRAPQRKPGNASRLAPFCARSLKGRDYFAAAALSRARTLRSVALASAFCSGLGGLGWSSPYLRTSTFTRWRPNFLAAARLGM